MKIPRLFASLGSEFFTPENLSAAVLTFETSGSALPYVVVGSTEAAGAPGGDLIAQAGRLFLLERKRLLPGDFNYDGDVTTLDLKLWEQALGSSFEGDIDADGDSDGADFLG